MSKLRVPITSQLEITDRCNYRCEHCYHLNFGCQRNNHDILDKQVIELAKKLVDAGLFSVVITGGEPLLRKNLVQYLVSFFKNCQIEVSLNTNLSLIDEKLIDKFIQYGLDGILVSCPASDPDIYREMTGGGNYFRFIEKLKILAVSSQKFVINMVVNDKNLYLIRQTAIAMKEQGVKYFGATPMALNPLYPNLKNFLTLDQVKFLIDEIIWIKENLFLNVDIFEALPKCIYSNEIRVKDFQFLKRSCQAGKTVISVSNTGDVRSCSHNNEIYGNLFKESLETIWQKMNHWRTQETIPSRCLNCKLVHKCFGGCRVSAKTITNNIKGEDPWMINPINSSLPKNIGKNFNNLNPDSIIVFNGKLKWRKEWDNEFLVASKKGARNLIIVNQLLLNFIIQLCQIAPISVGDLADRFATTCEDLNFIRIINNLHDRNFITIKFLQKEEVRIL